MHSFRVPVGPSAAIGLLLFAACAPAAESSRSYSVRGKVVDLKGQPIRGAAVVAFHCYSPIDPVLAKTVSDEQGAFRLSNIPERRATIAAAANGYAVDGCEVVFKADGSESERNLVLSQPTSVRVVATAPEGKPLPGAECSQIMLEGRNGRLELSAAKAAILGRPLPRTGPEGKAALTVPVDSRVAADFSHPAFAPGRAECGVPHPDKLVEVKLKKGLALTVRVEGPTLPPTVEIELLHNAIDHPSSIFGRTIRLEADRTFTAVVEPAKYFRLRVINSKYAVFPVQFFDMDLTNCDAAARTFRLQPFDATYEGQVTDKATGKPSSGVYASVSVFDQRHPLLDLGQGPGWMQLDFILTDAQGRYGLKGVSGPVRVEAHDTRLSLSVSPKALVEGKPGANVVAPFQTAQAKPFEGVVLSADGSPVANAVVTEGAGNYQFTVALTDESGRFTWTPQYLRRLAPTTADCETDLFVFHPKKPEEAKQAVRFGPNNDGSVFITLKPSGEVKPKRKTGEVDPDKPLVGKPAPELDAATVANAAGPVKLANLRGRYVVLEFWATWCGPCKRDMPKLKAAYQLYREMGLEIVGVHTNDVPTPDVAKFVEKEKMPYPIVRDSATGETVRRYGVVGYPTYFVIDPNGVVVDARSATHKELYWEMLPTIRSWMLSRNPPRPTR